MTARNRGDSLLVTAHNISVYIARDLDDSKLTMLQRAIHTHIYDFLFIIVFTQAKMNAY